MKFTVPAKVQEETYDVKITVSGKDEMGNRQTVEWIVYLEVEKKPHDNRITSAVINPAVVECSRAASLDISLMNKGSRDEDEIVLEAKSSALSLNFVNDDISLNQDPEAGSYPISLKIYYSDDILDDVATATLEVKDCATSTKTTPKTAEEKKEEEKQEPILEYQNETLIQILPETVTTSKELLFTDTTGYKVLIGGIVFLAGLGVIFIIAKILMTPKP